MGCRTRCARAVLLTQLRGGAPGEDKAAAAPSPSGSALPAPWGGTWTGVGPGTPDAEGAQSAAGAPSALTRRP
ncbi:hypothetical protein AB4039_04090 [Streptomyces sp. M-16]|uniref:hypothetical protein n=1 Tax=Streptomyces sp. M-16 TaxID=3233040 RepID=UPI003F9A5D83